MRRLGKSVPSNAVPSIPHRLQENGLPDPVRDCLVLGTLQGGLRRTHGKPFRWLAHCSEHLFSFHTSPTRQSSPAVPPVAENVFTPLITDEPPRPLST